jgi:hypothetical protein
VNKRHFLSASLFGAVTGAAALTGLANAQNGPKSALGPTLLTVTGSIGAGNRGAPDPALNQLMVEQKLVSSKAHAFDFAAVSALAAVTIKPTLEYDGKSHTLKGPLLANVMRACGVEEASGTVYLMRAIGGYVAQISAADAARYRYIVATHLDGRPLALGGLGPLWVVYDADRFPDSATKPLKERFVARPWGTYHIDVNNNKIT